MIEIQLTQLGSNKPGDKQSRFNDDKHEAGSMAEALAWLSKAYGINPPKTSTEANSVFVDTVKGTSRRVGFISRRWNSDVSHNSKAWWEENWVTFTSVTRSYIELKGDWKNEKR